MSTTIELFPTYDITNKHIDELLVGGGGVTVVRPRGDSTQLLESLHKHLVQEKVKFRQAPATRTGVIQNFLYRSLAEEKTYKGSLWYTLVTHIEKEINYSFRREGRHMLLQGGRFCINDVYIQEYTRNKDGYGIGPHRDQTGFINLIAICIIQGDSHFYICEDKSGRRKRLVQASAGDMILMRGNYFNNESVRPIHAVYGVENERMTLTMRELSADPKEREKIINTYKK